MFSYFNKSVLGIGFGDGSDFTCDIYVDRQFEFKMDFGVGTNCQVDYNNEKDELTVHPVNCPRLVGNVRMKFNCRSKSVPRGYENCAFYFWFNTAFAPTNQLTLKRTELDNPHKPKTWKTFRKDFSIVLNFNTVD